jgi:hypothetical protein
MHKARKSSHPENYDRIIHGNNFLVALSFEGLQQRVIPLNSEDMYRSHLVSELIVFPHFMAFLFPNVYPSFHCGWFKFNLGLTLNFVLTNQLLALSAWVSHFYQAMNSSLYLRMVWR